MLKKHTTRRRFLRGALNGAAVAVALPPLASLMSSRAWASDQVFPKRFGLFFWGNGFFNPGWHPSETGADYEMPHGLAPLMPIKPDISLVTGYEVKIPNLIAHGSGAGGMLTGRNIEIQNADDYTLTGKSIDQIIAAEKGGETQFRSIELAVQPDGKGYSYTAHGEQAFPDSDLISVYERLFGPSFREPGETAEIDPTLALRRSVLDAVMNDAHRLKTRLGAEDRIRLESHMDKVRDLELRIARMESDPPNFESCERPTEPIELPAIDGRPQMSARSAVMSDLATMAMACDLTRVLSIWHCDGLNNVLFPETTAGHHQLTHDEPDDQPQVTQITTSIMNDFRYFIENLKSIPEGDGTLLDNCLILGTSDCSYGKNHAIDEYPIILAGSAGGMIHTGIHHRSIGKENTSMVNFSILKAMDIHMASFGSEEGEAFNGVSEIEV